MASSTTATKCPRCTAPLTFEPVSGKLECEFCGSVFTPEEIDTLTAAQEQKASAAFEAQEQRAQTETQAAQADAAPQGDPLSSADGTGAEDTPGVIPESQKAAFKSSKWDDSTINENWGEASANMRAYSCSTCGGEIIAEATTGATICPFCGNSTIVPGTFSIGKKPNYIIPFKLTKDQAVEALKKHCKRKLFLPKEFKDENNISKLQGYYVPFWLFNGDCAAECSFKGTRSETHREGDFIVTNTSHYKIQRNGIVGFSKVPVDASSKMPDELMDSLEPYDFSELTPFSTAYLPGFVADRYDVDIESSHDRADSRCANTAYSIMRGEVHGYQTVSVSSQNAYMNRAFVEYALLPVYTIKTQFNDKTYLFAMNGQTGKLVGDLPQSRPKYWKFVGAVTAGIALVLFALGAGDAIANSIWNIIGSV